MDKNSPVKMLILLDPDSVDALTLKKGLSALTTVERLVTITFSSPKKLPANLADFNIIVTSEMNAPWAPQATGVNWIHSLNAGLEKIATPELLARKILISGSSGIHGPNIAEHVLMMMLMFSRRMPFFFRAQLKNQWTKPQSTASHFLSELSGETLGIFGLGHIGESLAERAKAFGMQVIGCTKNPSGKVTCADKVYGVDDWKNVFSLSDHFCITAPPTPETIGFFNADRLREFKKGVHIYNIARGSLIVEKDLIAALQAKHVGGAGLDVFEDEPLPPSSPLWAMENVLITPHVAGWTPHYFERASMILCENVAHFLKGERLKNQYDPHRGY